MQRSPAMDLGSERRTEIKRVLVAKDGIR